MLGSKMKFYSYWVFHAHTQHLLNKHFYVLTKIEATLIHNEVPIVFCKSNMEVCLKSFMIRVVFNEWKIRNRKVVLYFYMFPDNVTQ